tara:strand:- start:229 stop:435 length:207 start_codon:yes stop_codon:yes gene_type:complete
MNDIMPNKQGYDNNFYSKEIKKNINLFKFGTKIERTQAEKRLVELRGRLKFELRTANSQIKEILNKLN